MRQFCRIASPVAGVVVAAMILVAFIVPGCFKQNQDNSPISISNSQGRLMLSVACSTDGSVAYVTDGRNVYRYDRNASGGTASWACILSQGERLEMAATHDPREPLPADDAQNKTVPAEAGGADAGDAGK